MPDNVEINAVTTAGGQTIATLESGGIQHEKVIVEHLVAGVPTMTDAANPFPILDAAVLAKLSSDPATQTTLAALLAKVIAAPSTEAKQDIMVTGLAAILSKIIAAPSTEAKQDALLAELQLKADLTETQPVSLATIPLATGAATATKQDEQTALLTTLNSLIETNNYIMNFLSQLTGAMNSGAPALRTIPIASVSTAVTGSVTATVASTVVSSVTNFGTGIPATEMAHDINNFTAIVANINNVTA